MPRGLPLPGLGLGVLPGQAVAQPGDLDPPRQQVDEGPRRRNGAVGSKKLSSVDPSSVGSKVQLLKLSTAWVS